MNFNTTKIKKKNENGKNIVALVVEPVEWRLCAVGAVRGGPDELLVSGIGAASARDCGLGDGDVRC